MHEVFQQMVFRELSYEEDPESIVDMHRCAEILEGSWFDSSETCKLHSKAVVRSPGSCWVVSYGNIIFAHADLVANGKESAIVPRWRIHHDYQHPKVARKLLEGLKEEAKKREKADMVIFGDMDNTRETLEMIGVFADREYQFIETSEVDNSISLDFERFAVHPDDTAKVNFQPFLGSPLSSAFILNRAYIGAEYGVFKYLKPELYRIIFNSRPYVACYDGREWHIFREGNFKGEPEAILPILRTVGSLKGGKILLSSKAIEKADIAPASNGVCHDFYIKID